MSGILEREPRASPLMPGRSRAPHASIVIPTYNRPEFLERALTCALAQSHGALEVVVVDDGSEQATAAVVASIDDHRISYIRHDENRGKAAAWLTGIDRAQGRFLAFLPDDDVMLPSFVATRARHLEANADLAVVFSRYDIRSEDGELISVKNNDLDQECLLDSHELLLAALSQRWFLGASLYRKDAVAGLPSRARHASNALDLGINLGVALRGATGLFVPVSDFTYTDLPGQARHDARWETTFEDIDALLDATLAETALDARFEQAIPRELSNWNVVWGRKLRERSDADGAGKRFRRAIKVDGRNGWAWKQAARATFTRASRDIRS